MLSAKNISVVRGKRTILSEISLSLGKGELLALIGRNGSGKSTLLAAIAGTVGYRGELKLCGKDAAKLSPRERAAAVALMPQLLPRPLLTVRELLALGRTPYLPLSGRLSEHDREAVDRAAALVLPKELLDRTLPSLSGGELRRAYLGMALAQGTPILLLDEATAYLDGAGEAQLLSIARRLTREEGISVIAVLHDLGDALAYADRIALLDGGHLLACLTPAELLAGELPETLLGLTRYTAVSSDGASRTFFKANG